jgi:hypothetical protein
MYKTGIGLSLQCNSDLANILETANIQQLSGYS